MAYLLENRPHIIEMLLVTLVHSSHSSNVICSYNMLYSIIYAINRNDSFSFCRFLYQPQTTMSRVCICMYFKKNINVTDDLCVSLLLNSFRLWFPNGMKHLNVSCIIRIISSEKDTNERKIMFECIKSSML